MNFGMCAKRVLDLILPLWVAVVAGCGVEEELRFEHLELLPAQEELVEFPLGRYVIPVPLQGENRPENQPARNQLQIEFLLHALVPPGEQEAATTAWERHEGMFRDRVIRVCRSASLEDLQEPDLVALKSRLLDSTQPLFGRARVRGLLITEMYTQEL